MTDDSDAERSALSACFPTSRCLLCIFHVQQAMWRWLWDGSHHIAKDDRQELMWLVKNVINAPDLENFHNEIAKLRDNSTAKSYDQFMK